MIGVSHLDGVEAVRRAIDEDIGPGDVTSEACIPAGRMASGQFIAREEQVVAGVELLPLFYELRGGVTRLELQKTSGDQSAAANSLTSLSHNSLTHPTCHP